MNFREEAKTIAYDIPAITRKPFIDMMVALGASAHTASLYYHKYVHVPRKAATLEALKKSGPQRDARGRFVKKVA